MRGPWNRACLTVSILLLAWLAAAIAFHRWPQAGFVSSAVAGMDYHPAPKTHMSSPIFSDGLATLPSVAYVQPFVRANNVAIDPGHPDRAVRPERIDEDCVRQGARLFGIFCAPCHGLLGYGDGAVARLGLSAVANLVESRLVGYTDVELFDRVRNGINLMPPMGERLRNEQMWCVIAYIRALQLAYWIGQRGN